MCAFVSPFGLQKMNEWMEDPLRLWLNIKHSPFKVGEENASEDIVGETQNMKGMWRWIKKFIFLRGQIILLHFLPLLVSILIQLKQVDCKDILNQA